MEYGWICLLWINMSFCKCFVECLEWTESILCMKQTSCYCLWRYLPALQTSNRVYFAQEIFALVCFGGDFGFIVKFRWNLCSIITYTWTKKNMIFAHEKYLFRRPALKRLTSWRATKSRCMKALSAIEASIWHSKYPPTRIKPREFTHLIRGNREENTCNLYLKQFFFHSNDRKPKISEFRSIFPMLIKQSQYHSMLHQPSMQKFIDFSWFIPRNTKYQQSYSQKTIKISRHRGRIGS